MATPLDPSSPTNLDSPGQGDDEFRALKQWLVDVLGAPTAPTSITAAGLLFSAAGLTKIILQNLSADPAAAGELARNGSALEFYDTAVRKILHDGHRQLKFKAANEGYAPQSVLHADAELFLPMDASTRYAISLRMYHQAQAAAQGITVSLVGPVGVSGVWNALGYFASDVDAYGRFGVLTKAFGQSVTTFAASGECALWIDGIITTGVTAGNLALWWTGTLGQTMNVKGGSYLKLEKVP